MASEVPEAMSFKEWEVTGGTVKLPHYLDESTWYEFRHTTHALSCITLSKSGLPPTSGGAWLRDRRERLVSTGGFLVGEPEKFQHPAFTCEGFTYSGKEAVNKDEVAYFIVIETAELLLSMWVSTQRQSRGLVHALVERISPNARELDPLDGFEWRRAFNVRVPVPTGASHPAQFLFTGSGSELVVLCCSVAECAQHVSDTLDGIENELVPTLQGSHAQVRTKQDVDEEGQPTFAAVAAIALRERALVLRAQSVGAGSARFSSDWRFIVTNPSVLEE